MPGLSSVLAPPLCCRAKEPSAALACWRAPSQAIPSNTPRRGKPAGLGRGQSGAIAGCVCPERLPPGACACARTGVDEGGGGGNSRNIFFTLPITGGTAEEILGSMYRSSDPQPGAAGRDGGAKAVAKIKGLDVFLVSEARRAAQSPASSRRAHRLPTESGGISGGATNMPFYVRQAVPLAVDAGGPGTSPVPSPAKPRPDTVASSCLSTGDRRGGGGAMQQPAFSLPSHCVPRGRGRAGQGRGCKGPSPIQLRDGFAAIGPGGPGTRSSSPPQPAVPNLINPALFFISVLPTTIVIERRKAQGHCQPTAAGSDAISPVLVPPPHLSLSPPLARAVANNDALLTMSHPSRKMLSSRVSVQPLSPARARHDDTLGVP
ncbi:hypothetical protein Purlil1_8333 [Purpureocillium lilacinum]|uniref:Uncharacterized protein n=1 Tax=Purpureocillium lilacinum TaxID=33203 RepID=A0ABR0BUW7_PURLI|nr:hypothetical protein Purlil1_8333 [Purpureocillium lilacinum]